MRRRRGAERRARRARAPPPSRSLAALLRCPHRTQVNIRAQLTHQGERLIVRSDAGQAELASARARQARESAPLLSLIALVARARADASALAAAAAAAASQSEALRGELSASGGSGGGGGGSAASSRLQTKLLEAQEQLNAALREAGESARSRLALSESNQRLKEEAAASAAAAAASAAAHASACDERERLRGALGEREAQLSTAAEELVRTRGALAAKAAEAEALRAELGGAPVERARAAAELDEERRRVREARRDAERAAALLAGAQERIVELTRALQAAGGRANAATAQAAAPAPAPAAAVAAGAAAGLSSWLGKMAVAVRGAGGLAPAAPPPAAAAGAAGAAPAPAPPSLALPQPAGAPTYMSASVCSLASDYVFASLPPPSRVQCVIRAHATEVNAVRLHESGRLLAAGSSDGAVSLWAPASGGREGVLYPGAEGVAVLALDCAGGVLAAAYSDRCVRLFDLGTQRLTRSLQGHAGRVQALVYVPPSAAAGRGLVFSGSADKTVKLWDTRDGRAVRTLDCKSTVNGLALSADGMLLATANQDGGVRLFDVRAAGRTVADAPAAHAAAATGAAFSRDGASAKLLSTSRDNTLRVLDGRTLEPLAAFSPPSAALARAGEPPPALADAGAHQRARGGSSGASAGAAAGAPAIVMRAPGFRLPVNTARAAWSANGQYAVAGGDKGTVFTWGALDGALDAEIGAGDAGPHDGAAVFALDIAATSMATADEKGVCVVWESG